MANNNLDDFDKAEFSKNVQSETLYEKMKDCLTFKKIALFSAIILGVLYLFKPKMLINFLSVIWQLIY